MSDPTLREAAKLVIESRDYIVDAGPSETISTTALDALEAALSTTPAPSTYVDPKYVAFTGRAAEAMLRRLEHGRAKFGVDWDEQLYRDEDNLERLRRAVDHLETARRSTPDPEEWRKRAADVANQAFMFADPDRSTP